MLLGNFMSPRRQLPGALLLGFGIRQPWAPGLGTGEDTGAGDGRVSGQDGAGALGGPGRAAWTPLHPEGAALGVGTEDMVSVGPSCPLWALVSQAQAPGGAP